MGLANTGYEVVYTEEVGLNRLKIQMGIIHLVG